MHTFSPNSGREAITPDQKVAGLSPRSLVDKIWDQHSTSVDKDTAEPKNAHAGDLVDAGSQITETQVDHVYLHEHELGLIARLGEQGVQIHSPQGIVACADQQIGTRRDQENHPELGARWAQLSAQDLATIERLEGYSDQLGVPIFGPGDDRGGVLNVVGPEQGMTWPGSLVVGVDNHMSTHGAFGALGLAIDVHDLTSVVTRRSIIGSRPKVVRVTVQGNLKGHTDAKDLALWLLGQIGPISEDNVVLELAGSAVRNLSMEGRMTLCNMMVETGALSALVAPDQKTIDYLQPRLFAPKGKDWEEAARQWRSLTSDPGAPLAAEWALLASGVQPQVSWGTKAWQTCDLLGVVPEPNRSSEERYRVDVEALALQNLRPGTPVSQIPIDQVFIGSCANGRIEDLRAAANIFRGRSVKVSTLVVPGSQPVAVQAEAEGLVDIFREAGAEWRTPGCSLCIGANGDAVAPGTRLASTANNPAHNRVGPDSRVHVLGPVSAAASAITGYLSYPT